MRRSRFWILIACAVVFTVLGLAGGAYIYKRRYLRQSALEKGIIYARMQRYPEAIDEYKKALADHPNNPDIHYNLGLAYFRLNQYERALSEFKTAINLKPEYHNAALQMSYIHFTLGDNAKNKDPDSPLVLEHYEKAEEICNEIIHKDTKFVKAYEMLGHIDIARERLDEATENFQTAVEIEPTSVSSHLALIKHYRSLGKIREAEEHSIQFLEEIDPECVDIRLILSSIHEQQGRYDEAIAESKTIIKSDSQNLDAHIQLGLLYLRTGRYDDAEDEVKIIEKINPKLHVAKYIKGCLHLHQGELAKAIPDLQVAAINMPQTWEPHYYLALALKGSNRTEEAKTELNTVIALSPGFIPARTELAKLLAESGWYDDVIKHCKIVLEYEPENIEAMQLLGITYTDQKRFKDAQQMFDIILEIDHLAGLKNMVFLSLARGELSKCIAQCKETITIDPEDARLHYVLAEAYRRKGMVEDAKQELEEALRTKPSYPAAQLALAQILSSLGKEDEVIKILTDTISAKPDNLPSYVQLANLYRKRNENDKAIKLLKKALELNPNYYPAYMLASIYFIQGMIEESIDLYRKEVNLPDKKPASFLNLAIAYQRNGNYTAALDACRKAIDMQQKNSILYYTVLTNLHISQATYDAAIKSINEARDLLDDQKALLLKFIEISRSNKERGGEAGISLNHAILYGSSGMYDMAIAQCKKATSTLRNPQEVITRWVLANLYFSAGRLEDTAATYSEITKAAPTSTSLYTELGNVYSMMGRTHDAKDAYQMAVNISGENVQALLALASLHTQEGLYKDAIKLSEQALSHDPKSLNARSILAENYISLGKYDDAQDYLKDILRQNPASYSAYRMLARVKFATGQFDDCIKVCNICLLEHPEDLQLHNLLGLVYTRKGNVKAAIEAFGRVIDIDDTFVPAYIELASVDLITNRPKAAIELYQHALKIDPNAIAARYGLGTAYNQTGLFKQAIETYNNILKDRPDDVKSYVSMAETYSLAGDSAKALETVEKALDIAPKDPLAYTLLARIHRKDGNMDKTVEALEKVLEYEPKSLTGYELGLINIDHGKYDEAVAVYQKGVENHPEQAFMHFQLAVANQLKENYVQALNSCSKAIGLDSDNKTFLLGTVNILMAMGDHAHAKSRIKLSKHLVQDTKDSYLKFIDFGIQNKAAGKALSNYLNMASIYSLNRWYERSINAYEEAMKVAPADSFTLSSLANVQHASGLEEEAVENYKRALNKNPRCFTAHFRLAQILQQKEEYDKAIFHYEQAVSAHPESFEAHLNLGMLLETRGMIEKCIKEYEAAISLSPSIATPYNNLAWIYATSPTLPGTGINNKLDKALKLAKKASELSPERAPIRDTLGWIYHLKGMDNDAMSELEKAVRLDPENPSIHYHIASIYQIKGFKRRALAHFEKAIQIDENFPEADLARKAINEIKGSTTL